MNTLTVMIFSAIVFLSGMCLGAAISAVQTYKKPSGTIKVVTDKEDGHTYLFLELEESIDILAEKDTAVVKISRKN